MFSREEVWAYSSFGGALLRMKLWLAVILSAIFCAIFLRSAGKNDLHKIWGSRRRKLMLAVNAGLCLGLISILHELLFFVFPSQWWSPFAWFSFHLYNPDSIAGAVRGLCLDKSSPMEPLCLSPKSWDTLSGGKLSPRNRQDVDTVFRGIEFAKQDSVGLIVNVLARDTVDAVTPLRQNVEGLSHFFPKLSVVVFENDSSDGTREAFQEWKSQAKGYDVDILECEEAKDCKLKHVHRYKQAADSFASAVGKMASFRNRILDHIFSTPKYDDYSHMLVLDLDLQVSISPLGLVHSLGSEPHNVIASSGRMIGRASFGTLILPYDMTAFRPKVKRANEWMINAHQQYCELYPSGHIWRNLCDDLSPFHLALDVLEERMHRGRLYEVESAYNGAALYPLNKIRESRYDAGLDGQRCEHIGFNQAAKGSVYVNPKWNIHIDPEHPPGQSGDDAMQIVSGILLDPKAVTVVVGLRLLSGVFLTLMTTSLFLACGVWLTRKPRKIPVKKKTSFLPTSDEALAIAEEVAHTHCHWSAKIYRYTSRSPLVQNFAWVTNLVVDDIPFFTLIISGWLLASSCGYVGCGFSSVLSQCQNCFAVESLMKMTFRKPRPIYCGNPSLVILPGDHFGFPSGHTLRAFAVSFLMANPNFHMEWNIPSWCYILMAFCAGWARVALGKHTISDVVAGAVVGALLVTILEPTIGETLSTFSAIYFAVFGFLGLWDLLSPEEKGFCSITGLGRKKDKICSLCFCLGFGSFWLSNTTCSMRAYH